MTRTIKAKDIKPGMTIRWGEGDITHQCPIAGVERFNNDQDVQGETPRGQVALLHGDDDVLVVKEPPQPEEPTEFGAKVIADGEKFLRARHPISVPVPWLSESDGTWRNWPAILAMGPVTVVPDQGWTVPDTSEVPDRIEEWPENDTALRKHKWRDMDRDILSWAPAADKWECYGVSGDYVASYDRPLIRGPWTRVTDA